MTRSVAAPAWAVVLAPLMALNPAEDACATETALEEVLVTAARVPRSAQSVPLSLTAVSGEELRERNLTSARELASVVPNLTWLASDGATVSGVFIRGIGSPSIHSNELGSVGLYADDVTLNAPLLANPPLMDLERVEVLRGPWNAGFGRNASAGAVRFVSRAPAIGQQARVDALLSVGTHERVDAELAAGFPLTERSAARIAVSRQHLGDFIDNPTLARSEGGHTRTSLRARWRLESAGTTRVDVGLHGSRTDGDAVRYKQIGLGTPGDPGKSDCPYLAFNVMPGNGCVDQTGFADTAAFDQNFSGHPDRLATSVGGASVRIDHDFSGLRLTSLSAFEGGSSQRGEDTDGGPSFLFASNQETDSHQWSQDLELGSRGADGSGWQVGLVWLDEDSQYTSVRRTANPLLTPVLVPGVPIPEAGVRSLIFYGDLQQRLRHYSFWARADRALSASTTLAGELRVAHETLSGNLLAGAWADTVPELPPEPFLGRSDVEEFVASSLEVSGALTEACPAPFPLTRCYTRLQFERSDTLWGGRLTLARHFDEQLLGYASIASGFKGAGVSPIAREALVGLAPRTVDPERVITYELGLKSGWLQRSLRVNASVFFNEWSDYQLYLSESVPPIVLEGVLVNLPAARTFGGELEIDWTPNPLWLLHAGLGVTHSEVRDAGNLTDAVVGSPLIAAPELTFNALGARRWKIGPGWLTAQVQGSYSGPRHFTLDNDERQIEPGYWLIDASARFRFGTQLQFELALWGSNLGATRYCVRRGVVGGLGAGDVMNCQPNEGVRFFGMTLSLQAD
jgi:iron complex outermembrane recepter protein